MTRSGRRRAGGEARAWRELALRFLHRPNLATSTTITPNGSEAPFLWEPGTSFAKGDDFLYQAGGPITFEARMTPADEDGELVSEERQEIEVEAKIV